MIILPELETWLVFLPAYRQLSHEISQLREGDHPPLTIFRPARHSTGRRAGPEEAKVPSILTQAGRDRLTIG